MTVQRPTPRDSGLATLVFSGRRTPTVRRCVASISLLYGIAALALVPSSLVPSTTGIAVVTVSAASAFVVGMAWWFRPWSGRYDRAFVVYADIGTAAVLLTFRPAFPALAGVGLLIVISLFVLLYSDRITLVAHTSFALGVTVYLGAVAAHQGADPWGVVSQAVSLLCGSLAPVFITLYHANAIRQLDLVQRDELTGLCNRVGLDLAVTALTARRPNSKALVAVSIAVDNDAPATSPAMLVAENRDVLAVADALRTVLPAEAVLARTAPKEFVVCVVDDDRDTGLATIIDLQATLSASSPRFQPNRLVTGFAIVEVSPHGRDTAGWSVQRAIAAAEVRRQERGSAQAIAPTDEIREAASRIAAVISGGGPDIVFQPICRADDQTIVGYEALSRFPDFGGGTAAWFAAAADTGLGAALDRSAIEKTLQEAAQLPPTGFISVNLAAATLLIDGDLSGLLIDACRIRPMVVEITEHAAIDEHSAVLAALAELRRGGVAIAVDDVGAGHAGLRQLVLLEPDIIKLDAFVVHDMGDDPTRLAAAEFILAFARKTGARCVFEGIESDADLAAAQSLDADLLQGYLLGRPTPATAIASAD